MKTVLLLGSGGMLGQALYKTFREHGFCVCGASRSKADVCFDFRNDRKLAQCVEDVRPDIIVNAAAAVNLELCERDYASAYAVNSRMPSVLAGLCEQHGVYLIHVSTDHFYQGDGNMKHDEQYPVRLVNEYARTKYLGEQLVLLYPHSLVLRTNIVGFRGGERETFTEWAIREIRQQEKMTLYADFYTSPVYVDDFASILIDLMKTEAQGVYNLASKDVSSKKAFILALAEAVFHTHPDYKEASIREAAGVRRADSLGLNTSKIEKLLGYAMPSFQETIQSIKKEYTGRNIKNEISHIRYHK